MSLVDRSRPSDNAWDNAGKGYVDVSTVDPQTAQQICQVRHLTNLLSSRLASLTCESMCPRMPCIFGSCRANGDIPAAEALVNQCRRYGMHLLLLHSTGPALWPSWIKARDHVLYVFPVMQVVTEAGGSYLEAPVGGSKQPAEQGNLVFLCGGDKALFDKCAPLLDVMGKAKFFLGEVRPQHSGHLLSLRSLPHAALILTDGSSCGVQCTILFTHVTHVNIASLQKNWCIHTPSALECIPRSVSRRLKVGRGSQMKLIINMMLGAIMTVNAEGIALAQSLGLRVEEFIEVVNLGAMGTPMFKLKVWECHLLHIQYCSLTR